ncbi:MULTISPECIES: DUF2059 domain-containing protein [unclassified Novosphingobium]|uniref:DUF2059 domain-containing protein n=1 Tax=unclassified Novosphingobium TaxID=2644732 RepID=UPI00146EB615|nr:MULTISPECIES: DUF2059 domain-containing protein [unclassified Novosphingobium]NMN03758.1 hypothetical protein [Novosphingobium sp. SG919]NMN86252.1 hypothetical protein [Novosphingobium sp. SG916]
MDHLPRIWEKPMMPFARRAMALAVLATIAMPLSPAAAQTTPPPAAVPLNPADVAVANQIIAVILPPEQRLAIVERVTQAMMAAMRGNIAAGLGVDDPGLNQIFDTMLEKMPAAMRPAMERHLPELTQAMAHAYVRRFSSEDLRAILAFAQTPAGGRYLSRAAELMQDPEVVAVMGALNREGMSVGMATAQEMKAQITDYLAKHPEVARKMAAAHGEAH